MRKKINLFKDSTAKFGGLIFFSVQKKYAVRVWLDCDLHKSLKHNTTNRVENVRSCRKYHLKVVPNLSIASPVYFLLFYFISFLSSGYRVIQSVYTDSIFLSRNKFTCILFDILVNWVAKAYISNLLRVSNAPFCQFLLPFTQIMFAVTNSVDGSGFIPSINKIQTRIYYVEGVYEIFVKRWTILCMRSFTVLTLNKYSNFCTATTEISKRKCMCFLQYC